MTSDTTALRFPAACPRCSALAGQPFQASPTDDQIIVQVRCSQCSHEWQVQAASRALYVEPKPDRRKTDRA